MAEPLAPERLEWIRRCNRTDKANHGALWEDHGEPAERHRDELLSEVDRLKAENAHLAEERDLAVAHDRQPYPTQWAYDQACAALAKHRDRADAAEAVMRQALGEVEHEEVVYLLNRYLAAAEAVSG